jgi:hydroxymethylglutaryl-CoA synthase
VKEDIVSMVMTAIANFLEKYNIDKNSIGRLEIGTETIQDHAKSIKTSCMQLFADVENTDIEGIDCTNACYGGTNALFACLDWIESSAWDGRYAMFVAADIAEYATGPARPTCGAGAVVMLLGANAPLVIDRGVRSTHMEHAWDFYKPNMMQPYPCVDGKFSNSCYLRALDKCYSLFRKKWASVHSETDRFTLNSFDYAVLHAPYNKLTQKAFGRLYYSHFKGRTEEVETNCYSPDWSSLEQFGSLTEEEGYVNVPLEKALVQMSASAYSEKVGPATLLPKQLGILYTASLYAGLLSLFYNKNEELVGKRILCFSYGSGLAASMFSMYVAETAKDSPICSTNSTEPNQVQKSVEVLRKWKSILDLDARLNARVKTPVDYFTQSLEAREKLHIESSFEVEDIPHHHLVTGTYYLLRKDELSRRQYARSGDEKDKILSA